MANIVSAWPDWINEVFKASVKYDVEEDTPRGETQMLSGSRIVRAYRHRPIRKISIDITSRPGLYISDFGLDLHYVLLNILSFISGEGRSIYYKEEYGQLNGLVKIGEIKSNLFSGGVAMISTDEESSPDAVVCIGEDLIPIASADSIIHQPANALDFWQSHTFVNPVAAQDPNVVTCGISSGSTRYHAGTDFKIPGQISFVLPSPMAGADVDSAEIQDSMCIVVPGAENWIKTTGPIYAKLAVKAGLLSSTVTVTPVIAGIVSPFAATLIDVGQSASMSSGESKIFSVSKTGVLASAYDYLTVGFSVDGSSGDFIHLTNALISEHDIQENFITGGSGIGYVNPFTYTAEDRTPVYVAYNSESPIREFVKCTANVKRSFLPDGTMTASITFKEV
jgi:hypothetical protein